MNLRILKKLSKRAAPYLPMVGYHGEFFKAEKNDNYTGLLIMDRSCWERGASVHGDTLRQHEIKWLARNAKGRGNCVWCYMAQPSHPLKGTPMVGGTSGGECPEWSEMTAWEALSEWVRWQYFDFDLDRFTRAFRTPGEVFRAADELLLAIEAERETQ